MSADRREFVSVDDDGAMIVPPGGPGPSMENLDAVLFARQVHVAIVGAGLADLTAARELVNNSVSVCVLKARDRGGGRALDHPFGGGHVVEEKVSLETDW